MTAPRATGAASPEVEREIAPEIVLAAPPEPVRAPAIAPELPVADLVDADHASEPVLNEPRADGPRMDTATEIGEIEQVADVLVAAGSAAKVTVLGTASSESITLTALTLARLMAQQAKVVVVDLVASSPMIPATSADPVAPGLAELMQGEASFAQIITKDRLVARSSRQRRTPRLRPRAAPVAAADARDRCAAAGLRPCAAGCRRGLRSAGRIADVAGAGSRGARSVDGAGRARADVRPAQGGRLLRGDDAEQAMPGVGCGRAGPARGGGVNARTSACDATPGM